VATVTRGELPGLRRRIGVVFQEVRLLDHLTTYDNVALPLRVAGQREESYRADVMELRAGRFSEQAAAYPRSLRRRKQRAAIARRHCQARLPLAMNRRNVNPAWAAGCPPLHGTEPPGDHGIHRHDTQLIIRPACPSCTSSAAIWLRQHDETNPSSPEAARSRH
jgi:hypothetical protein